MIILKIYLFENMSLLQATTLKPYFRNSVRIIDSWIDYYNDTICIYLVTCLMVFLVEGGVMSYSHDDEMMTVK